jgi:hyperosmotically inducible periplasmic protein
MNTRQRMTLLAALLASAGLVAAGCGERSTEKVSSTVDRTTTTIAANTEQAADKAATMVGDAAITGKVKAAMIAEPGLKSMQIDVDTKNGIVTLTGTVDTALDKERALQLAQTVNGVVSVVDRMSLNSTG